MTNSDEEFDDSEEAWADRAMNERASNTAHGYNNGSSDPDIAYELHDDTLLNAVLDGDLQRVKHLLEWSEVPITQRAVDAGLYEFIHNRFFDVAVLCNLSDPLQFVHLVILWLQRSSSSTWRRAASPPYRRNHP